MQVDKPKWFKDSPMTKCYVPTIQGLCGALYEIETYGTTTQNVRINVDGSGPWLTVPAMKSLSISLMHLALYLEQKK